MAYGDFLKYFQVRKNTTIQTTKFMNLKTLQTLDICHINHSVDQEITFHGRWENGLNAGGVQKGDFRNYAKNPQCFIKLTDPDPRDPSRFFFKTILVLMYLKIFAFFIKVENPVP